jgi:restriction system protein
MPDAQPHEKIIAIRQRKAEAEQCAIKEDELRHAKLKLQVHQVRNDQHFDKLNSRNAATEKRKKTLALTKGYREAEKLIEKHKETLLLKYRQCFRLDDYGQTILVNESGWVSEIEYFVNGVIGNTIESSIFARIDKKKLFSDIDSVIKSEISSAIPIKKIPFDMEGVEYESHCAEVLRNSGWKTSLTKGSGDQGVDILAIKNNITVAIQCKRLSKPVGNKAVQEAFAGMQFVKGNFSVVVTNSSYTPGAREIARETGTFLLNDNNLPQLESLIKQRCTPY